jgi:hypothetical protein
MAKDWVEPALIVIAPDGVIEPLAPAEAVIVCVTGAATVTASEAAVVPSPLVPLSPSAESPAPYNVAEPEDGAVQLKLKLTLPVPSTALAVVWTICPLISFVPWVDIEARVPAVAETSKPPDTRCPPLMVRA